MLDNLISLWESTGIAKLFNYDPIYFVKTLIMYVIVGVLVYLAVRDKIAPETFINIYLPVISFYFGTQYEKNAKTKE